jgi:Ca2+/H+ antiporter
MKISEINPFYAISLVIISIIGALLLKQEGIISAGILSAVIYAGVITTLNFTLGMITIKTGLKKSPKDFMIIFLGGMVFRLFLMVILVFICIKFLEFSRNSYIFLILFFYVFYLIIEILYLNTKKS